MALTIDDSGSRIATYTPPPPPPASTTRPAYSAPEPTYSPFGGPTAPTTPPPSGPYALPAGSTLLDTVSGKQAQPFDVTLSQLATAVYGTRGDPPQGWSAVTDADLAARGVADPQAWREQFLGGGEQTTAQEFKAEVYTDGQGNYVLSYRGTAEGAADWDNNFAQGLGFETPDGDKFSVTAANTAVEFERVFGNTPDGESTNLAITGHSQGGGLATVGSLASGVPAVTFDASGIHPNTWDRMGIDPQAARDLAENGQIRAYSLSEDALTQVQDSWATGLMAPDALGTQIVVNPAARDANSMFTNYGPMEGFSEEQSQQINTAVELGRNPLTGPLISAGLAPLTFAGGGLAGTALFGPQGTLPGTAVGALAAPLVVIGGSNLAYAAISHSPNALTAGMIENQPWQAGYQNPTSLGRELQNLVPDAVKDDYARNTHDLATDIQQVNNTQFAEGKYVQGAANIYGDVVEGFYNSVGDTVDGYADSAAQAIDQNVDGWVGDVLSGAVDGAGDVAEFSADVIGQGNEFLADAGGWVAQGVTDGAKAVGDFLNPFN